VLDRFERRPDDVCSASGRDTGRRLPMQDEPTTRDDVLLWLNDRIGKRVNVSVELEKGDYPVTVLEAEGELLHWRDTDSARTTPVRDELIGWYAVGDARFDLSDLDHLDAWIRDGMVDVELAENVTLRIRGLVH
jgi:hypothetical protein